MTVHVKTACIKGEPNASSHSKLLSARHTWATWKNDNPKARMHRGDVDALKQTFVAKGSLTGEFTHKHKPEFVPLKEWSAEKDGAYTEEAVDTITAFGEIVRGVWKHNDDKTLVYTSTDSTSVEQQTELHDGAGPFAAESVGASTRCC